MPSETGARKKLEAIGGQKYTVALNSQVNMQDFEVIRPCNSLLMRIKQIEDIWLRIQYEDKNYKRENIVSDIPLVDYLCIAQRLYPKCHVLDVDVDTGEFDEEDEPIYEAWKQFLLPLSFNGDLDLSRDNKLVIQMYQKTDEPVEVRAYFEYYCVGRPGYPVCIDREKILQSEDYTTRDFIGYDYAYFPAGVAFDYVQYEQAGYIGGSRQTTFAQAKYDADIFDMKNDIAFANDGILFDTRERSELTISHMNEDDIVVYKIDCLKMPVVRHSISPSTRAAVERVQQKREEEIKARGAESLAAGVITGGGTPTGSAASLLGNVLTKRLK